MKVEQKYYKMNLHFVCLFASAMLLFLLWLLSGRSLTTAPATGAKHQRIHRGISINTKIILKSCLFLFFCFFVAFSSKSERDLIGVFVFVHLGDFGSQPSRSYIEN